jgi:hypothetical protein
LDNEDGEKVMFTRPKVMSGDCDHFYEEDGIDSEGVSHAQCKYCWAGRRFKPSEYYIADGKFVEVKEK